LPKRPAPWESRLAARYNKPNFPLFGFDVYAVAGDGRLLDLQRLWKGCIGMRTFGESAPLQKLMKRFGFEVDAVVTGSPGASG
jgi:transketolase